MTLKQFSVSVQVLLFFVTCMMSLVLTKLAVDMNEIMKMMREANAFVEEQESFEFHGMDYDPGPGIDPDDM